MLIAGGGTGGHLYPGIALAEELTTQAKGNDVLFVGTPRGLEAKVVPTLGYALELLDVRPLKGRGFFTLLHSLFVLPFALVSAVRIIRRFRPHVAVGVGGYASGPVLLAAWLCHVPSVILEQNTIPGLTNRVLSRFAQRVFIAFESSREFFPRRKALVLGNPVRRQFLDAFLSTKKEGGALKLLVLGGSQGAHGLNLRVLEAAQAAPDLFSGVRVVHQTGTRDEALVKKRYQELGIDAEVYAFIDDMCSAYQAADLVVCRAGATTIAELLVAKRAAILVPYPHASDNHQELNAREMVDKGAAVMLVERELDGVRLADEVRLLLNDRPRREVMERAASRVGRPEAAREILESCSELAQGRRR